MVLVYCYQSRTHQILYRLSSCHVQLPDEWHRIRTGTSLPCTTAHLRSSWIPQRMNKESPLGQGSELILDSIMLPHVCYCMQRMKPAQRHTAADVLFLCSFCPSTKSKVSPRQWHSFTHTQTHPHTPTHTHTPTPTLSLCVCMHFQCI